MELIKKVFQYRFYKEIVLLIILFLLLILVWLNRYSYSASVDTNGVIGWKINNFTGKACALQLSGNTELTKGGNLIYDFADCLKIQGK